MKTLNKTVLSISVAVALMSSQASAYEPITICGGLQGGFYEATANTLATNIKRLLNVETKTLVTGGSIDNANRFKKGECQIAIMQSDAVTSKALPTDIGVTNVHTEAVFWIHPKGGMNDFTQITKDANKGKVVIYVTGSGSEITLKNFQKVDEDYALVKTVEVEDWYLAAEAVAQGFIMQSGVKYPVAGMIYVGRPAFLPKDIIEDFGTKIMVGALSESSFSNAKDAVGEPLYFDCAISKKETSGIELSTFFKPKTYCMNAQVVYNNGYHAALNSQEQREVRKSISKATNALLK